MKPETNTVESPTEGTEESILDLLADDRIALLNERVCTLERSVRESDELISDLLAQSSADFEERTWLRRLFSDVQNFEPSSSQQDLKVNLVAPLRHLLGARCVRLLPATSEFGRRSEAELPHVVVGDSALTAEESARFVCDVLDLTHSTRFLYNRSNEETHSHIVPDGVESAIALGVELDGRIRGWLLAFDKILRPEEVEQNGQSEREFGTVEFSLAECAAASLAARLRLLEAAVAISN